MTKERCERRVRIGLRTQKVRSPKIPRLVIYDELYGSEDVPTIPDVILHCPFCGAAMITGVNETPASYLNFSYSHRTLHTWRCTECNEQTRISTGQHEKDNWVP